MIDSRIALTLTALLCCALGAGPAAGEDLQEATLSGAEGAVDYYQVICPAGTDQLKLWAGRSGSPDPTLLQNLRVTKGGNAATALSATPGRTTEIALEGGKGKYSVIIDTKGSAAASKQTYALGFQCLNDAGRPVRTSLSNATGVLKKKAKTFRVNCAKTKANGKPHKLLVQLTNTTKGTPILIAQAVKTGLSAVSVPEGFPGELAGGAGDYLVTVAHTGTPAAADFQYALQTSCRDGSDAETGTPTVALLQASIP